MENIILNRRKDTCSSQYIIIFTKLQPMGQKHKVLCFFFILFAIIINIVNVFCLKVSFTKASSEWLHLPFLLMAHRMAATNDLLSCRGVNVGYSDAVLAYYSYQCRTIRTIKTFYKCNGEMCIWEAEGQGLSNASDCLKSCVSAGACRVVGARKQSRQCLARKHRRWGLCRLKQAFVDKAVARCCRMAMLAFGLGVVFWVELQSCSLVLPKYLIISFWIDRFSKQTS